MRFRFIPGLTAAAATALAAVCCSASGSAAIGDAGASRPAPLRDIAGVWREARKADPKTEAAKKEEAKKVAASPDDKSGDKKGGKPVPAGVFGDWGAFLAANGKDKTCYALAKPKERAPPALKRDDAFVFISTRPADKVRNEVSVIMGFAMEDDADVEASVGGSKFELAAKGANAWIKNPAEEGSFIEAARKGEKKGARLIVKAPSLKGNVTTDSYSLAGIAEALDKVKKECP